jgi:hypothetical protein
MEYDAIPSVTPPQTVLQTLFTSSFNGLLRLVIPGHLARFYFDKGTLVFATFESREEKTEGLLIKKSSIKREQRESALGNWIEFAGKKRIMQIMIEQEDIDLESLIPSLQDQIKCVVYEVLNWEKKYIIYLNQVEPKNAYNFWRAVARKMREVYYSTQRY